MNNVANGAVRSAGGVPRRSFLKIAGASGFRAGAVSGVRARWRPANRRSQRPRPHPLRCRPQTPPASSPPSNPAPLCASPLDGTTTVVINRLDFGQGVQTALPMILAEELDADWSKVKSVHGDANPAYFDPGFGMHLTGGSNTIKNSYTQYRELGARTRAMLVAAAAAQWQVPAADLRTQERLCDWPRRQKTRLRRTGRRPQ